MATLKKLKVRIHPDYPHHHLHHRAGIDITPRWQTVEVDDETAADLRAEKILDVQEIAVKQSEENLNPEGEKTDAKD